MKIHSSSIRKIISAFLHPLLVIRLVNSENKDDYFNFWVCFIKDKGYFIAKEERGIGFHNNDPHNIESSLRYQKWNQTQEDGNTKKGLELFLFTLDKDFDNYEIKILYLGSINETSQKSFEFAEEEENVGYSVFC